MSKEFQIRDGNLIASFDLENEDGDIDFCKLFKVSHGVADEIGMFVDYVATNKIIKDQSKQIADLEAKLAEKDEKIKYYKDWLDDVLLTSVDHESYNATINEYEEEINQLKQQLAEKEKELEEVKKSKTYIMNFGDKVKEVQVVDDNQDKISFALEQLEKVKEFCDNPKYQVEYEYYTDCWTAAIDKDSLLNEIDNQIEELKKGVE